MNCPICYISTVSDKSVKIRSTLHGKLVDCPVCGVFGITADACEDYLYDGDQARSEFNEIQRSKLSHRLRSIGSGTGAKIKIDSEYLQSFMDQGYPGPSPAEQADNAIKYFGSRVLSTGKNIQNIEASFYAEIGSPNFQFSIGIVEKLINESLLVGINVSSRDGKKYIDIDLTLDGWRYFENLKQNSELQKQIFIAMKFNDKTLDSLCNDIIKPAIASNLNLLALDMRDVSQAGIIDNIMRTQIKDSALVLADLSHDNLGAYWEAGYAEGLGKPVIYLCERSKFEETQTHFDTNHCTTVIWSKGNEKQFTSELIATIRRSLNLFG